MLSLTIFRRRVEIGLPSASPTARRVGLCRRASVVAGRLRPVAAQVLNKEMVDRTRAGSPFAPVLRASEIALDWREGRGSSLVDVDDLDAPLGTFFESLDSECEQVLRVRPLDARAKALF